MAITKRTHFVGRITKRTHLNVAPVRRRRRQRQELPQVREMRRKLGERDKARALEWGG